MKVSICFYLYACWGGLRGSKWSQVDEHRSEFPLGSLVSNLSPNDRSQVTIWQIIQEMLNSKFYSIHYSHGTNFSCALLTKKLIKNTIPLPKIEKKNSFRLTHHGIQVESVDVWSVHAVPELDTASRVVYGHLGTNISCCVIGSSSTGLGVDVFTWKN